MNKMETAVFVYLSAKILSKKRGSNRKWWIHPINEVRYSEGAFYCLFPKLREDPIKFFNYFRMSVPTFEELFKKIKDGIARQNTIMRVAIPAEEMLAMTLRYLGSGCSLVELHYTYRVDRSTASIIVRKVCSEIWNILYVQCMPKPDKKKWLEISDLFEKRANFPHCLGAADGKHVRLVKPAHSASLYYNYKNYFSLNLMAVADANYQFIYVDIGSFGKDSDPTIFDNSSLWRNLENGNLDIPDANKINGIDSPMPFAFVADDAFSLSKHVLKPFKGKCLTYEKRIFNYRLSRARRFVECTFGILANKWRIFHTPINVEVELAIDIVKCCCVLHNFVRERDGFEFEHTLSVPGLKNYESCSDRAAVNKTVGLYRTKLSSYFVSETGKVSWQDEKI